MNVSQQTNGMVNVSLGNAATAAVGGTPDATPLVNGASVNLGANLTDANLSGAGGTLGSLLSLYDSTTGTGKLPTYLTQLDGVANQLVSTVNGAIGPAVTNARTPRRSSTPPVPRRPRSR